MANKKDIAYKMASKMADTHGTIMGVIGAGLKKVHDEKYSTKVKPFMDMKKISRRVPSNGRVDKFLDYHDKVRGNKVSSKEYTNTRCGHCGKFGHHHSTHAQNAMKGNTDKYGLHDPTMSQKSWSAKRIKGM